MFNSKKIKELEGRLLTLERRAFIRSCSDGLWEEHMTTEVVRLIIDHLGLELRKNYGITHTTLEKKPKAK